MNSDDTAAIDFEWETAVDTRGSGKRGIAPCGHSGTYVTNNFVTCDLRCEFEPSDGVPRVIVPEETMPICPFGCYGSEIIKWGPEFAKNGRDFWICSDCGRSFHA